MIFYKETSDSSKFYSPNAAAGYSNLSTTGVSELAIEKFRNQPEVKLVFQKIETVLVRPQKQVLITA
jgi:hypothetical protein